MGGVQIPKRSRALIVSKGVSKEGLSHSCTVILRWNIFFCSAVCFLIFFYDLFERNWLFLRVLVTLQSLLHWIGLTYCATYMIFTGTVEFSMAYCRVFFYWFLKASAYWGSNRLVPLIIDRDKNFWTDGQRDILDTILIWIPICIWKKQKESLTAGLDNSLFF